MSIRRAGRLLLALAAAGAAGAGEPRVVKLPAPAKPPVAAADGRLLAMHLPKAKQIAVFDVSVGKVVKLLPAPDDDVLLAGGRDYLFVVRTSDNTMQRWGLATFEKEATVRLPVDTTFEEACMGCGSNGPLVLRQPNEPAEGRLVLLNPVTNRAVPTAGYVPPAGYSALRASPDGQVFAWRTTGIREVAVMRGVDGKFAAATVAADLHELQPGPGGRFLYTPSRAYDEQVRPLHPRADVIPTNWVTAAVQGPMFLESERLPGPPGTGPKGYRKVHLFFEGQFRPVATIDGLEKYDTMAWAPVFVPRYGRLIFFGKDADELMVHELDLDALLAKSDVDFLVVMSDPPSQAVAGRPFGYAPVVKSRKGGVKLKLDAGPDGMTLGADGKLTWDVPAALAGREVAVVVSVSDAAGQDLFHTFRLAVVAPPAGKP